MSRGVRMVKHVWCAFVLNTGWVCSSASGVYRLHISVNTSTCNREREKLKVIPVRPQLGDLLALAASVDVRCSQLGDVFRAVVES